MLSVKLVFGVSFSKKFYEKLVEYAFAAQHHLTNTIYVTFTLNITKTCDYEKRHMKPFVPDLDILASTDPVTINKACLDLLEQRAGKKLFKDKYALTYAEEIRPRMQAYQLNS